jgi:hypothetical protein
MMSSRPLRAGGVLKKTGWLWRFQLACSYWVEKIPQSRRIGSEDECVLDDQRFAAVFSTIGDALWALCLIILDENPRSDLNWLYMAMVLVEGNVWKFGPSLGWKPRIWSYAG